MHSLNLKLTLMAASIYLIHSTSYAQPGDTNPPTSTTGKSTITAMSPDDFSSKVGSLSKETKGRLKDEVKTELPNPSNGSKSASPSQTTNDDTNTTTTDSSTSQPTQNTYQPQSTTNSSSPSRPSSGAAPINTAPPTQNQTYTGFGARNKTTSGSGTTSPSNSSSGGWNVKY